MTKRQLTTQLIMTKATTQRYVHKELEPFGLPDFKLNILNP